MRPRRLEVVRALKLMKERQVSGEYEESDSGKCGLGEEGESIQAEQPYDEVQFMTGAVVNASAIAKGVVKICRNFRDSGGRGKADCIVPRHALSRDGIQEEAK